MKMGCNCCGGDNKPEENKDISVVENEGPLKKRRCTDFLCLIIFMLYSFGMVASLFLGLFWGNAHRVINGYDVTGDVCGLKNDPVLDVHKSGKDLTSRKYLYFDFMKTVQILGSDAIARIDKESLIDPKIDFCLDSNPNALKLQSSIDKRFFLKDKKSLKSLAIDLTRNLPLAFNSKKLAMLQLSGGISVYDTKKLLSSSAEALATFDPIQQILVGGGACRFCVEECPKNYSSFLNRCTPTTIFNSALSITSGTGTQTFSETLVADVKASWVEIIYMLLIAFALTIVATILLRFFTGIFVYLTLILVMFSLISLTISLWISWEMRRDNGNSLDNKKKNQSLHQLHGTEFGEIVFNSFKHSEKKSLLLGHLLIAITVTIVTVIVLLLVLAMRRRLNFAIKLIKEAAKAIHSVPFVIFMPLITFMIVFTFIIVWIVGFVWIESTGYSKQSNTTGFVTFTKGPYFNIVRAYNVVGLVWVIQFIINCQHISIAGIIATWYFSREKSIMKCSICKSVCRLVRYHLGTVALGSFLIICTKPFRVLLGLFFAKSNSGNGSSKVRARCCSCFCKCCVIIFEKVLSVISKQAYIKTAMYGTNFFSSGRKAYQTISSCAMNFFTVNMIGSFVLYMSKIGIMALTIFSGIQIIHAKNSGAKGHIIQYTWVPVFIGALFSYIISTSFMSSCSMIIETLFLCFCEDAIYEKNNGKNKPHLMKESLGALVKDDTKNKDKK